MAETLPRLLAVLQIAHLLVGEGGEETAGLQVAVDIVFGNTLADDIAALEAHAHNGIGGILAIAGFDGIVIAAVAVDDLPAVAPRCAIGDFRGFKHINLQPLFGQMQRG